MAKHKFMEIKNQTEDKAELYLYGDIVSSEWGKWVDSDTCPEDVRNFLSGLDGTENLDIYVNSGGGSVFAGLAIYNMLKRNTANKTVYIDGLAASIASVIAMAGDKIVMPNNAFLMIHKAWNLGYGNANELRKMADDLDKLDEGILNVYKDNLRENVDIQTVKDMINKETWLTGEEAAQYFNIDVVEANNSAACISDNFKNYKNTPEKLKLKTQEPKDNLKIEKEKLLMELDLI